ncbi:hypothetical protein [Paraburkholderia tuberum]|uniref:Uncharacterized protein n=1 Tax=Paraburkholderia tuberum TaxID=157910 RepID=A0A1H1KHI2_9BURK|nr:hypothetical protein [Paraburkholderia tuberum]SDR61783.1 hypothetical protein SAMN05445850_7959 [Paraburkholderia tuberum]
MKFLSGSATDADHVKADVEVSQQRTLLKFADGTFAVRENKYKTIANPYLEFGPQKTFTVSIHGHSYGDVSDSTTANYLLFRNSSLMLPNTCIECAEHTLKCIHANAHSAARIEDNTGARVLMSIGNTSADIDVDDMNNEAFDAFPHGITNAADATLEGFAPGDGMALVYSLNPAQRGNQWTVHAVAVLLKSVYVWDRFIVVTEMFAPDHGSDVEMKNDWSLSCYLDAQDFKDTYSYLMKPAKYTLWKLSAMPR